MPNAKVVKPLFKNPSRSPNGIGTVLKEDIKGKYGRPDPSQWMTDYCDFVSGDLAAAWAAALVVGTGTATQLAGDGGLVTIVNSAASGDTTSLVKTAATGQNFAWATNRGLIFEARASVDSGTLGNMGAGLVPTGQSFDTFTTSGFVLQWNGTNWVFTSKGAGTTAITIPTAQIPAPVASTQVTFGFAYKGTQTVVNGVTTYEFVIQVDLNDGNGMRQYNAQIPSTSIGASNLMPTIGVKNNSAVARTCNVDYVFAAKERFNA